MKLLLLVICNFIFFFVSAQEPVPKNIYDFKVPAQNGGVIDFAQYKGKKILIVNTPTEDNNNAHYAELEATYQKYKDKLVIIGFLDRDFMVAPGSRKSISNTPLTYSVSFPLGAKVLVRGDDMAPLYKWLTEKKYNDLKDNEVKWDFQKYLINEKGTLVAIFDPKVKSSSAQVVAAIEQQ